MQMYRKFPKHLPVCPLWAAEIKAEVNSCWWWWISNSGSWLSSIDNKVTFPWEAAWRRRVCPSSRGTGSPQVSEGTMEGHQPGRVQATAVTSEAGCLCCFKTCSLNHNITQTKDSIFLLRNNLRPVSLQQCWLRQVFCNSVAKLPSREMNIWPNSVKTKGKCLWCTHFDTTSEMYYSRVYQQSTHSILLIKSFLKC